MIEREIFSQKEVTRPIIKIVFTRSGVMEIKNRLDLTLIFCDVDDFCQNFEYYWQQQPLLTSITGEKLCRSRMSLSEVMTIAIAFLGCWL